MSKKKEISTYLLDYEATSTKFKSNWFERGIIKQITPRGLNIYLSLFRTLLNNQQHKYTYKFITSIDIMKKNLPSSYTREEIVNSLKLMQSLKIIEITNISRWDQLVVGKKIESSKTLIIKATDSPNLKNVDGKDVPVSEEDYFTYVHLPMIDYFQTHHTLRCEELICYYAIVMKYLNAASCNVAYDKMELWTGIDKNTMQRTALEVELMGLVRIRNESRGESKINHHHYFCYRFNIDFWKSWFDSNKSDIEAHLKTREKRKSINKGKFVLSDKVDLKKKLFGN